MNRDNILLELFDREIVCIVLIHSIHLLDEQVHFLMQ